MAGGEVGGNRFPSAHCYRVVAHLDKALAICKQLLRCRTLRWQAVRDCASEAGAETRKYADSPAADYSPRGCRSRKFRK